MEKEFVRTKELQQLTSCSKSTLYAWADEGWFPKPMSGLWDQKAVNEGIRRRMREVNPSPKEKAEGLDKELYSQLETDFA